MDYEKIYYDLVYTRKKQNRNKKTEYYESHHIIPRSWGGNDDNDNIVLLTAKEHWVAHLLLSKFATGQNKYKAYQAVVNMGRVIPESKRNTSSLYALARKAISKEVSKRHTGTLIVKDVRTNKMIGRVPKNHEKVVSGEWVFFHTGIKRSNEYISNKCLENRGENNPRYSGISDEEIVRYGVELFGKIGEISPLADLRLYVDCVYDLKIPKSFSRFRFPDKSYYQLVEEETKSKYNKYKRGEAKKAYQKKFKEIINAHN